LKGKYSPDLGSSISDLKEKLRHRTRDVCELFKKFSWQDVEIVQLNSEIAKLKEAIHQQIILIISNRYAHESPDVEKKLVQLAKVRLEIDVSKWVKEAFNDIVTTHKRYLRNLQPKEEIEARLHREVDLHREIYNLLLQQARGAQIRKSATFKEGQMAFKILVPPQRQLHLLQPVDPKTLIIAVLIGLLGGLCVIVTLETLNPSVRTIKDVTKIIGVPVIAVIPKISMASAPRLSLAKYVFFIFIPVTILCILFLTCS
jgi:uncharacterized protein involved in exopolysaccharide biosynthesis